jgi:hypothetical protein
MRTGWIRLAIGVVVGCLPFGACVRAVHQKAAQPSLWRQMDTGRPDAGFSAIWGASPSEVFAGGGYLADKVPTGLIMHYDGAKWSTSVAGLADFVVALWGSGATDVFAAANRDSTAGPGVIYHYGGVSWSPMLGSDVDEGYSGIWGMAPDNVYAATYEAQVLRYDGSRWSKFADSSSIGDATAIWGSASSSLYVLGDDRVYHFNGWCWSTITLGYSFISMFGLYGISTTQIWAVGAMTPEEDSGFGPASSVVFRVDGESWSQYAAPGTALVAVWGASPSDVFAVGGAGVIVHFDGSSWSGMARATDVGLSAVWGSSGSDVFTAGDNGIILHYNGTE